MNIKKLLKTLSNTKKDTAIIYRFKHLIDGIKFNVSILTTPYSYNSDINKWYTIAYYTISTNENHPIIVQRQYERDIFNKILKDETKLLNEFIDEPHVQHYISYYLENRDE